MDFVPKVFGGNGIGSVELFVGSICWQVAGLRRAAGANHRPAGLSKYFDEREACTAVSSCYDDNFFVLHTGTIPLGEAGLGVGMEYNRSYHAVLGIRYGGRKMRDVGIERICLGVVSHSDCRMGPWV